MTKSRDETDQRAAETAEVDLGPRLDQLFERYSRPVSYFFARRGFSKEDCRELTQETFLGAHKGMERFRRDASVETWLFTIAANIWRNELRRRSAEMREGFMVSLDKLLVEGQQLEEQDPLSRASDPLAATLAKERRRLLHEALQELPDQMRRCVLLRIDQELKYREIAAAMQISINTVKSQLFQARERLQARLSEIADQQPGAEERALKEA